MRKLLTLLCLLIVTAVSAQAPDARAIETSPAARQWGSIGAATRFDRTGITLAYGQQDMFSPGTDGRFGVGYMVGGFSTTTFSLELSADALAYTYDPKPDTGLALVAYGGLGPRLLVETGIYDYYSFGELSNAYRLNIGGVGGLETRLNQFGVFLELDLSIAVIGLVGSYFRVFPLEFFPIPKLTLGANYFF